MGGGAVSSVDTGQYDNSIELNAVQRANPEMQKRVANVIRALAEADETPIVSIHDHGAGGHLNCLSELVEATGGKIDMTGTEPDKPNFVQRNRIIAGICDAVVIIESAVRGGSLLTADAANQYNREVLAIPGRVGDTRSAGCNELIRQNKAALIQSASDLITAMPI